MSDRVIDVLTSFESPETVCVMGNEAVVRGALEAGVQGVFAYPGTPSTEISELFSIVSNYPVHDVDRSRYPDFVPYTLLFEYSVNEKIALEKAIGYSIGQKRALCCMKNVGMNVASDALMTIAYQEIGAPLVIVVCDDPGCHSSSNEQDSRYWGRMASVPVFNPATPADAYWMTMDGFCLSEMLKLPVIIRLTTRVSHAKSTLQFHRLALNPQKGRFESNPIHINIPERNAVAHQRLVEKLQSDSINSFFEENSKVLFSEKKDALGIIASGVAAVYLEEIIRTCKLEERLAVLNLGLVFPVPQKAIMDFFRRGFEKIMVLEELEPIIENQVRVLLHKNQDLTPVMGKGFSSLKNTGEYSLSIVRKAISDFIEEPLERKRIPLPGAEEFTRNLPLRPPTLCTGCPHRATYYALKLALPDRKTGPVLCGDIGCMGLGALPPLQMLDTVNHMGMSIPMAQGIADAVKDNNAAGAVAIIGDGTFFHSGIPALLNAVYTNSDITVIVFDNRTTAMTGGQENPGAAISGNFKHVDIKDLIRGLGVQYVETMDPLNVPDAYAKIKQALSIKGVSVVVAASPCVQLTPLVKGNRIVVVDHNRCSTCFHHEDTSLACSQICNSQSNLARGRAKIAAETHIPAEDQRCPANICNHGFFNAILAGNYKTAVDIVRDSLLFARTCGDICHKPCENGSTDGVPIKKLKNFVSSIDENFLDFSGPQKRRAEADLNRNRVAVVGAGPAGLSAAYDLALQGYPVTIYEKESEAGGLLKYGIPDFRMQKEGYDTEINFLKKLGVTFNLNQSLGTDIFLSQLSDDFEAVVLAVGLGKSKSLKLIDENVPENRRFNAVDFLKSYHFNTLELEPNATVLVIGGGNSAIDAARTAKHISGNLKVVLSCIETRDEMPAFDEEIREAEETDIEFIHNSYVDQIRMSDSAQIETVLHTFATKKHLKNIRADYVVSAIGLEGDPHILDSQQNLKMNLAGRIVAGENSRDGNIFVAGDLLEGNHMSLIGAIASGKKAAVEIRKRLEGYGFNYEGEQALRNLNANAPQPKAAENRSGDSTTVADGQLKKDIVNFDLYQPCQRCSNCIDNFGCPSLLRIDGQIVIDQNSCTACGVCIDVCPNNAIVWEEIEA
ncbi:MAG: FAD-dependent oxidoreductase [Desulfobacterales bacterium]|nr:FAD-dependent oxidoreductase [Desulfobacterales bacterium]